MSWPVAFLATVDGDLRIGTHAQQEAAVCALLQLFDDCGLAGHTTWFINEQDFSWTTAHPDLLRRLLDRGDALGAHDHFDTHDVTSYQQALSLAGASRARLQDFCAAHDYRLPLTAHRNGCFLQREAYYQALIDLGYQLVSDCLPGQYSCTRMVKLDSTSPRWLEIVDDRRWETDNRWLALAATPWRHDAGNWTDSASRRGTLLQLPVICAPYLDVERMERALAASAPPVCLCWDTHPYNIQDPVTGDVDPARVDAFRTGIRLVLAHTGAEARHVYEIAGELATDATWGEV
ncbi:MAG TPA: hypothetical protein VGA61_22570 [Anaerolineae bacterium]